MNKTNVFFLIISLLLFFVVVVLALKLSNAKTEIHLLKEKIKALEEVSLPQNKSISKDLEQNSDFGKSDISSEPFYPYQDIILNHAAFGYPFDANTSDDYIIERQQFILSYCPAKNVANWVAWELNDTWIGDEDRYSGKFISDTTLPSHFETITHDDYTHSGFDRGHLVRSKDRTRNSEDNKSTFLMSNVLPQTPDLNRGVWLEFEDYCLEKAQKEKKNMYIIAGGIFHNDSTLKGEGKIAIPDSCFKIVTFWPKNQNYSKANNKIEIISVCMPNIQGIRNKPWEAYLSSVNRIEKSTQYNFLPLLPDSVEEILESRFYRMHSSVD